MSFLEFIQATSPRFPGSVTRVLGSGNAFIDSDLSLPMITGYFTESFFVQSDEARHFSEGDGVTFQWKKPGEPGTNPRGGTANPVAIDVQHASDEEREAFTQTLRKRQRLFQQLSNIAAGDLNIESILAEAEEVLSDPETAVSAALAIFAKARTLVHDEQEASEQIQRLEEDILHLNTRHEDLRNREVAVLADEDRLAPLREFAASVRLEELDAAPREPDLPHTDASIHELAGALTPLATEFVRWTTLLALFTVAVNGRLLLLDGPVGTGKSSLAERIAQSCGGRCEVIPVRPAWVESSDLLGFFDPLSQVFRSGPFTDALASPITDRVNVVVLDEMNIARVENYAADLISRVERIAHAYQVRETPVGIPTWSPAEWQALRSEWDSLVALDAQTPEAARRVAQLRHTFKYRPNLMPIDGLAIVGTLNTDDTTYDVSPKVIDRSFAVTFPPANLDDRLLVGNHLRFGVSMRRLRSAVSSQSHANHGSLWEQLLQAVDEDTMALIGVPYSHRFAADFDTFIAIGNYLEVPEGSLLPMFVYSRVLPRIRFFKDDKRVVAAQSALERVRSLQGGQPDRAWDNLLDRLEVQCQDERVRIVRFWHEYTS